jgi:hypothetical protein
MANLIRSAKSGMDWSIYELSAYNIIVHRENAVEFFGQHELGPIDHLDPNLLSAADPTIAVDQNTYRFLSYLGLALCVNYGQESAIDDFGKSVLEVTGFDEKGTILRRCYDIPLTICSDEDRCSRTDICLVHLNSMILLVVQENATDDSIYKPEAQVIAEAIATFQNNNEKRLAFGAPPLSSMTIPCITMIGTQPFFYKVPVTMELGTAVAAGQYPEQPTIVTCCTPPIRRRPWEGMKAPDYRRTALQYYNAFRGLAKSCWTAFLADCVQVSMLVNCWGLRSD